MSEKQQPSLETFFTQKPAKEKETPKDQKKAETKQPEKKEEKPVIEEYDLDDESDEENGKDEEKIFKGAPVEILPIGLIKLSN